MKPHLATAMAAGTDPAWMTEFADLVCIVQALPPQAHQQLDLHFIATITAEHCDADRRARRLAARLHRLAWAEGDLWYLRTLCPAAAVAAMAVLVRDALHPRDFAVLTFTWDSVGLAAPWSKSSV